MELSDNQCLIAVKKNGQMIMETYLMLPNDLMTDQMFNNVLNHTLDSLKEKIYTEQKV